MMDHMLVRVGKYLRIIGCDAEWDLSRRTRELIPLANVQKRIFVTCNQRLPDEYPKPDHALLLPIGDPVDQFYQILLTYRLDPLRRLFTKCIRCNVFLEEIADLETARARVPPAVLARHSRFFSCPACRTVFWFGSHVRNTCAKLGIPAPQDFQPPTAGNPF
jgi:hypothetical protein